LAFQVLALAFWQALIQN